MSSVVYALFADKADASAATVAIRKTSPRGQPRVAHLLTRSPLEGNDLPEPATGFGRNLLIAIGLGAAFIGTAGAVAGALDLMLGMGVLMGIGLGSVTGALMGFVGAMQAGTRIPKPELRALEPRIAKGEILLVIEVPGRDVDATITLLQEHHGESADAVGEW